MKKIPCSRIRSEASVLKTCIAPPQTSGSAVLRVVLLLLWCATTVFGESVHPSPEFSATPAAILPTAGPSAWEAACPADYHPVALTSLRSAPRAGGKAAPSPTVRRAFAFIDRQTLMESNPLDIDRYLAARIPAPIRALLASPTSRLILLPDLLPEAISALHQQGLATGTAFLANLDARVQVAFLLFQHPQGVTVVVTHLFGKTRLEHLVWQYSFLYHRLGRNPDEIEIWETRNPDLLSRELCFDALKDLQPDQPTVIFSGYFGSLKHLLADAEVFARSHPGAMPSRADFDLIRATRNPGQIEPKPGGNPFFPWWETRLQHSDGRSTRCIGFRNLYGDQTGILLSCLLEKGFRRFVLFSNAGGLAHTRLRELYAPVVARSGNEVVLMKNRAAQIFPGRSLVSVPSLLIETKPWLERHALCSLVDVECFHAAQALQPYPEANLFYGILVSDQPGKVDITRKDEDAPEVIEAKRAFFFSVIRNILRSEF